MPDQHTPATPRPQLALCVPGVTQASDRDTIEDLGSAIDRVVALLRAAINASDEDDGSWLVSIALDHAVAGHKGFTEWALPDNGEAQ